MKGYKFKRGQFHITAEGLKELDKEWDSKLLKLLGYLRRRRQKIEISK